MRLGDAGGNGADANLGHQLDANARVVVRILQIVDQLRQIFDGIYVVVRRRRDQADAGRRVADPGNPRIDFVAGELAAFARLGALGYLNLQFLGVDQIFAGDPKSAGGHLLDGAVARVTVGIESVPGGVLTAFAGVALAADAIHGDGQGFVSFLADRAVGHGPGFEALHDRFDGLDFIDRDRLCGKLQLEQPAQGTKPFGLIVDQVAVLFEDLVVPGAAGVLEFVNGLRVKEMILAVTTPLILPAGIEHLTVELPVREGVLVPDFHFSGNDVQPRSLHTRSGPAEIFIDEGFI